MPTKSASSRDLAARIDEVKMKIILLDGDRRAHTESSENVLKENREKISILMEENKNMRKILSEANKSNGTEKRIIIGEDTNGDLKNKLNLLRYETKKKEKILKEMHKQNNSTQNKESSDVKEKQAARDLENRLDKTNLKQKEAEHIQRTYQQIKSKLEDEHKTYESQLDEIQQEIGRMKGQMKELHAMNAEAICSRDQARSELERREKEVYADRKRMELEMQKVKKEVEEKKALHNQIANKRQEARHSIVEELTDEQRQRLREEEEEERIRNYENFFRVIKEATGVSDTQEVVIRFEMQGETKEQLIQLKLENEGTISELTVRKDTLNKKYEELIYSGDSSLEKKEELNIQNEDLSKEIERKNEVELKLQKSTKVLIDAKSGIDHLEEKLQPIILDEADEIEDKKTNDDRISKKDADVDEYDSADKDGETQVGEDSQIKESKRIEEPAEDYEETEETKKQEDYKLVDEEVLNKLNTCEKKLLKLVRHVENELIVEGKDMKQVCKEMEDLEFQLASEIQLPAHNTRIHIADETKEAMFAEDDQSGEDEEVLTREKMKKQSQQIVESKNKRMMGKRKKKKVPTATLR